MCFVMTGSSATLYNSLDILWCKAAPAFCIGAFSLKRSRVEEKQSLLYMPAPAIVTGMVS